MSKIRKALMAAGGAAVAVFTTAVTTDGLPTSVEGWSALLGAALGAAIVAGVAVYAVRNAGQSYR